MSDFDVASYWNGLSPTEQIVYPIVAPLLLIISGICSGLTIGLFSIDMMELKLQMETGSPEEKHRAIKLFPLLERGNHTLVVLLVTNTLCMTALPLIIEFMLGSILALIISVTLLLLFGEVIPQAIFVRHNVAVCSFFLPFFYIAAVITFPLSYPLALFIDYAVGSEDNAITKETVLDVVHQLEEAADEGNSTGGVTHTVAPLELRLMKGAMKLPHKKIKDLAIESIDTEVMIEAKERLTPEKTREILAGDRFRIPVYLGDRRHVIGVLVVKSLLALAYSKGKVWSIMDLPLHEPLRVTVDTPVIELYRAFRDAGCHIAAVYSGRGVLQGFVTLEQVFEMIHDQSLRDELDSTDDEEDSAPSPTLPPIANSSFTLNGTHTLNASMAGPHKHRGFEIVAAYQSIKEHQHPHEAGTATPQLQPPPPPTPPVAATGTAA